MFFFYILSAIFIDAYTDAKKIKKHEEIDHKASFFFFSLAALFGTGLFMALDIEEVWASDLIFCGFTTLLARTAIFDFLLNKLRGLNLWYDSATTTSEIDQKIKFDKNIIRVPSFIGLIVWLIYMNPIWKWMNSILYNI
jgi:hypothetical protein